MQHHGTCAEIFSAAPSFNIAGIFARANHHTLRIFGCWVFLYKIYRTISVTELPEMIPSFFNATSFTGA